MREARAYLCKLAVDQLSRQNIKGLMETRKYKNTKVFEEYLINFRTELENG